MNEAKDARIIFPRLYDVEKIGKRHWKKKNRRWLDLKFVLENVTRGWIVFCLLIVRFNVDCMGKWLLFLMN